MTKKTVLYTFISLVIILSAVILFSILKQPGKNSPPIVQETSIVTTNVNITDSTVSKSTASTSDYTGGTETTSTKTTQAPVTTVFNTVNQTKPAASTNPPATTKAPAPTNPPDKTGFPEKGIPVLMYHSISTVPGNTLCVPEEQFKNEMEWLYNQQYYTLTIDEFYDALINGKPIPEKSVLITFDDGYLDNYTSAWPILKEYGFRATFFIVTNFVGGEAYVNWEQLKELVNEGNSIGSHTVRHYDLKTLSAEKQKEEITLSKQILETNLGIDIKAFCYPIGHYNDTTLDIVSNSGYKLAFTTKGGKTRLGDKPLELYRVRISGGTSLSGFKNQVS